MLWGIIVLGLIVLSISFLQHKYSREEGLAVGGLALVILVMGIFVLTTTSSKWETLGSVDIPGVGQVTKYKSYDPVGRAIFTFPANWYSAYRLTLPSGKTVDITKGEAEKLLWGKQ